MNYVITVLFAFIVMIWYVRPLYNFFAIRKYSLLHDGGISLSVAIKSSLPSILFYSLLLGLFFYPVITKELINVVQSGSIFVSEVIFIFVLTRIDKNQTKYTVTTTGIKHHWKLIKWSSKPTITFKKSLLFVLHKPRFILKDGSSKIVIPILSKNIESFVKEFLKHNKTQGLLSKKIYDNTIAYYLENKNLIKELNKND